MRALAIHQRAPAEGWAAAAAKERPLPPARLLEMMQPQEVKQSLLSGWMQRSLLAQCSKVRMESSLLL